ncbi:unnamed protein product [Malus baccata var. baccata]
MRGVKPLPEAVRSLMRSGVVLHELTSFVEELIFNSLYAGATKVSVFVGVGTCYVKVADDGVVHNRIALGLCARCKCLYLGMDDNRKDVGTTGTDLLLFLLSSFKLVKLSNVASLFMEMISLKVINHEHFDGFCYITRDKCLLAFSLDNSTYIKNLINHLVVVVVVVRDLFYNQPVRRKYMQSSPKQVLHSVNKCVHRIALVHSNVSFKVVDIEIEDELLGTTPSPSPLILLKRTFGTEISNALHELNISDGRLELSGYISTPCNNLADKMSYILFLILTLADINLRFVCRGPIHKLLNQLASSFEFWDPGKAIDGSKNRKQSRPKAFTAYVLNLSCPRTFYDLTFESSKTYVEFKDISRESGCHGADILEENQMRKKGGNIKSADENLLDGDLSELSKFGKRKSRKSCQASPDLMDMLIQEDNHRSQKRYGNILGGIEFSSHTAYSFQSRDDTLDKCMVTTTQKKEDHFWKSDIKRFSGEDYILENRSSGGERSSNVEDNIFSSKWQDEPFKVDSSVGIDSATSRVSYDHHEFDSDVEYLVQPFLKNCSSKERFLCERDLCVDDGSRYQNDGFGNKRRRGGSYNCVQIPEIDGSKGFDFFPRTLWPEKESTARPLTRVVTKFDLPTEFDSSSRPLIKSLPHYEELFYEEGSVIDFNGIIDMLKGQLIRILWIVKKRTAHLHCTTYKDHGLDVGDYLDSGKFFQLHNLDGEFSLECPDILADETDWSCLHPCSKDNKGTDLYKIQKHKFRVQDCLQNQSSIGRLRRSHSAPPFYRSQRRYFTLSHPLTTTASKPDAQTFRDAPTYPEVSKMKDLHQPSGGYHLNLKPSSVEDFPLDTRTQVKHKLFMIKTYSISSGFLHLSADSLVPQSINKNCLSDCRVLRQVDKKYIAVMAGTTLAVIDQVRLLCIFLGWYLSFGLGLVLFCKSALSFLLNKGHLHFTYRLQQ